MTLLFFVERHCCRQVHFVHLTDGHRREGDVPNGKVRALDTGYGRRGAVLRPHLVDQHDGACQAQSAHHGPQHPVDNLSVCRDGLTTAARAPAHAPTCLCGRLHDPDPKQRVSPEPWALHKGCTSKTGPTMRITVRMHEATERAV